MASVSLCKGFLSTSTPIPKLNERNIFRKHIVPELPKHALSPIKEILPVKKVFTEYLYELNDTASNECSNQKQHNEKIAVKRLFADTSVPKCDVTTSSKSDTLSQCTSLSALSNLEYGACFFKNSHEKSSVSSPISCLSNDHNILETDSDLSCLINEKCKYISFFKLIDKYEDLNSVMTKKSYHVPNKSNFDILMELKETNCYSILSQILSYLSAQELCNVSFVSNSWREIVIEDKLANERRNHYLKQKRRAVFGPNKENILSSAVRTGRDPNIFCSMINISSENAEKPLGLFLNSKSRHQSFLDVARTLEMNDKLLKCPKCQYPAKCEKGSKYCCTRNLCQYCFCSICQTPYMGSHICTIRNLSEDVPKIIVGSKQSKKNLKRL